MHSQSSWLQLPYLHRNPLHSCCQWTIIISQSHKNKWKELNVWSLLQKCIKMRSGESLNPYILNNQYNSGLARCLNIILNFVHQVWKWFNHLVCTWLHWTSKAGLFHHWFPLNTILDLSRHNSWNKRASTNWIIGYVFYNSRFVFMFDVVSVPQQKIKDKKIHNKQSKKLT